MNMEMKKITVELELNENLSKLAKINPQLKNISLKKISVEFDLNETLDAFVKLHSQLNNITYDKALEECLNIGIAEGEIDFNRAIYKGMLKQTKSIDEIILHNQLQKIVDGPIPTYKEVIETLNPHVELCRDERLIAEIKSKHKDQLPKEFKE